ENDGITFTINADQYNEVKYSNIDNVTKLEMPPVTIIPSSVQTPPTNVLITSFEKISQGISSTTVRFSWDAVEGAIEYEVQWQRDNSDWINVPRTGTTSVELDNAYSGGYLARVRAKNAGGVFS